MGMKKNYLSPITMVTDVTVALPIATSPDPNGTPVVDEVQGNVEIGIGGNRGSSGGVDEFDARRGTADQDFGSLW